METIKNNLKIIINVAVAAVIIILFIYSFKLETSSDDLISIAFEKSFKLSKGFSFRVTNKSGLDLNSVKMIINPKLDPAFDYVCYPRRALFRNGFTLHDTSEFVNVKGEYFSPAEGESFDIYIECRTAEGKFYKAAQKIQYK